MCNRCGGGSSADPPSAAGVLEIRNSIEAIEMQQSGPIGGGSSADPPSAAAAHCMHAHSFACP